MFKHAKLKSALVMLLATIFTFLVFTPAAEAAGKPGGKNAAPVIKGQGSTLSASIIANTTYSVTLSATDANGDLLDWSISSEAKNGTASSSNTISTKSPSNTTINYVPNTNFTGIDSFTITVKDSRGLADNLIVSITITPAQTNPNINYVALGDSIATGTIFSGKVIKSYVGYFYDYLKTQNPNVSLTNLAKDGDRTNELYSKLSSDNTIIAAVKKANIITISIGGNNLMQAAKDSRSLGGYNFNRINETVAEQGKSDFAAQWVPIINKIKSLNSNAKIIVNTIYNPYNETDALHPTVDKYLSRDDKSGINDIISSNTSLGYYIADVFTAFDAHHDNMSEITYFYPSDFLGSLTRNPHPNAVGQGIITTLHKDQYDSLAQ